MKWKTWVIERIGGGERPTAVYHTACVDGNSEEEAKWEALSVAYVRGVSAKDVTRVTATQL